MRGKDPEGIHDEIVLLHWWPMPGAAEDFLRRLREIGGPPAGWKIYPHAANDGKALHIAEVESEQEILDHLEHFADIYERTDIIESVERP